MSYTLRPYQQEAVSRGVEFLKSNSKENHLQILPTGSGKSLIIANIAKELGAPTIVFQPSKEILEQNRSKFLSYGYSASAYSASVGEKIVSDVTFATIGSVKTKPDIFKEFKYILVDECDAINSKDGMYKRFIDAMPQAKVLGFTATPYRLSNDNFGGAMLKFITRTRPRVFSDVNYYIQNKELFDQGYLAPIKYFSIKGFTRKGLKVNTTGSNYTDKSVQEYYRVSHFPDRIVKVVNRLLEIGKKNVLVFTSFVDEAAYVASKVPGAVFISSDTPKDERERIVRDFRSGKIKVVCNVGIFSIGFDYPELEAVVLARATMSLRVYYQQIGRGIRPHPDKKHLMVVDMCQNIEVFGHVEDLHIHNGGGGKWFVSNSQRILTNRYLTQDFVPFHR